MLYRRPLLSLQEGRNTTLTMQAIARIQQNLQRGVAPRGVPRTELLAQQQQQAARPQERGNDVRQAL